MKNKKLKIGIAGAVIIALMGFLFVRHEQTKFVPLKNWISYGDPKGRFSILLPRLPSEDTQNDKYTAINGEASYTIYVKNGKNLDDEAKNISNNGKVIYQDHHNDASGTPYIDFKIETKNTFKKGRMFLINKNIYVLLDEIALKANDNDEFNHFLSSFSINYL